VNSSTARTASPALCSLPHGRRVLYVGTFSKTLHPGLRLGFLVLPPRWCRPSPAPRPCATATAPGDAQAVLARFIAEGHMLRHLRRMRELYPQRQRRADRARWRRPATARCSWRPAEQGMHLLLEAPAGRSDLALSAQALQAGVVLAPLSRYTIESRRRGWLFGYAVFMPSRA
jgi:GntR family transcriptional regulator/MocR family aminotransferase